MSTSDLWEVVEDPAGDGSYWVNKVTGEIADEQPRLRRTDSVNLGRGSIYVGSEASGSVGLRRLASISLLGTSADLSREVAEANTSRGPAPMPPVTALPPPIGGLSAPLSMPPPLPGLVAAPLMPPPLPGLSVPPPGSVVGDGQRP